MSNRVLILGGSGFIGTHLTKYLVDAGFNVKILARSGRSLSNSESFIDRVEVVFGDYQDEFVLRSIFSEIDIVVHLVTTTYPQTSIHSGIYDVQTNLIPTIRLLEECERSGIRKLIYLSSGGTVYGEPQELPITEEHPLDPSSIYGSSKKLIESYMDFFQKNCGFSVATLRVSNPYGPGQNPMGLQGLVAAACSILINSKIFTVLGDGSATRDYLYIDDLVRAIFLAIENTESIKLNISSGVESSVSDILEILQNISSKDFSLKFVDSPPGYVHRNVLSSQKAARVLNWKPKVDLQEGLSRTWSSAAHT